MFVTVMFSDGVEEHVFVNLLYDLCENIRTIFWHMSAPVWWLSFWLRNLKITLFRSFLFWTSLKTNNGSHYVDSAKCPACGSTAVVYDIEINDAMIEKMGKMTGQTREAVLINLKAIQERMKPE